MKHGFRPRRTGFVNWLSRMRRQPIEIVELKTFDGYVVEDLSFYPGDDDRYVALVRIIPEADEIAQGKAIDDWFDRTYAEVVCPVCGNRDGVGVDEAVGIATGKISGPPCSAGSGECPGRMVPPIGATSIQRALPAPPAATSVARFASIHWFESVKIEPVALS